MKDRYSYDAWGRPRDPATWALKPVDINSALTSSSLYAMQPRFDHGYTGQELMAGFGLINMNGRLYDPYLQRFISPDDEVQDPGEAQNFNRYTYCMNNPLMYIDPSGYTWFSRLGNFLGSGGRSAVLIGVGIGIAAAVACIPGLDAVGIAFIGGMLSGAASGGLGAAFEGGNVLQGAILGAAMGAATGVATLGLASAISYGLNNISICEPYPSSWGSGEIAGDKTLGGYLSYLSDRYLSIGNLINGVSNMELTSAAAGVIPSLMLPTITSSVNTSGLMLTPAQDNEIFLEYHYSDTGNGYRTTGTLSWHNDSGDQVGETYSVSSGSGPCGMLPDGGCAIDQGTWDAYKYVTLTYAKSLSAYFHYGDGFKVRLVNQFHRTNMLIHPTKTTTAGCIGLTGNKSELLDFQNRIKNYLVIQGHHHMEVRVINQ